MLNSTPDSLSGLLCPLLGGDAAAGAGRGLPSGELFNQLLGLLQQGVPGDGSALAEMGLPGAEGQPVTALTELRKALSQVADGGENALNLQALSQALAPHSTGNELAAGGKPLPQSGNNLPPLSSGNLPGVLPVGINDLDLALRRTDSTAAQERRAGASGEQELPASLGLQSDRGLQRAIAAGAEHGQGLARDQGLPQQAVAASVVPPWLQQRQVLQPSVQTPQAVSNADPDNAGVGIELRPPMGAATATANSGLLDRFNAETFASRLETMREQRSAIPESRSGVDLGNRMAMAAISTQSLAAPAAAANRGPQILIPQHALTDPAFGDAFGQRISYLVHNGVQSATIQLTPQELGNIQVRVAMGAEGARIEFHAQHSNTGDLIESMLPRLNAALDAQGLRVDDVRVSQQGASDNGGSLAQGKDNPDHSNARQTEQGAERGRRAPSREPETAELAAGSPPPTTESHAAVDFYA